jgi:hypothetical protein
MKVTRKGPVSISSIAKRPSDFFVNFPLTEDGKQVEFTDFNYMKQPQLFAWRDHIYESFRERSSDDPEYERPLRFLTLAGTQPKLSMLSMGTSKATKEAAQKSQKKRKNKGRRPSASEPEPEPESEPVSAKKKGDKKSKKKKSSSRVPSETESEPEAEFSEGSGDGKQPTPAPMERPERVARETAKKSISRHAVADSKEEERLEREQSAARTVVTSTLSPGERERLRENAFKGRRALRENVDGAISHYLQRPYVSQGPTLSVDWRKADWDEQKVSWQLSGGEPVTS